MRHFFCSLIIALFFVGGGTPANADIDAVAVRKAIDRAIRFLKREQKPDGKWDSYGTYAGGVSGLCTLALLEAGVPADDPSVKDALTHLRSIRRDPNFKESTYSISLFTMVLCRAGITDDMPTIRQNARWLIDKQIRGVTGKTNGSWSYPDGAGDPSNTQFAVLALHEASLLGVEIDHHVWGSVLDYWARIQNADGSWGYGARGSPGKGSMTCAGIASVVIAQHHLNQADATIRADDCVCERQADDAIARNGLQWMGNHFSTSRHPAMNLRSPREHFYYYLYGVERVGRMTAQRFFVSNRVRGRVTERYDWYREGADHLVGTQSTDGAWRRDFASGQYPLLGTSFGLLFLSKGRRPVLVSKLQRDGHDWQRLHHDVANLTGYTERQWKMPLTWQVIDANTAGVEDYVQSPVLFLSGKDALDFSPKQVATLRAYVENGGFIFADSCCGDGEFEASFRDLMRKVFPEPELRLKPLDPEHPIWSIEEIPDPKYIGPGKRWLEGINVGCRTSVVFSSGNLSCYWELAGSGPATRFSDEFQREINACRAVGINVLAYATNRELRDKDSVPRPIVESDDAPATTRGHLAVAKLRHAGGCDAAPRALSNLMRAVDGELEIRTSRQSKLLPITDDQIFNHHLVFMHGRHDFRLNEMEIEQLRTFVERGGMIFADAICGSEKFAVAMRREMARVFPDNKLERIAATDPILTPAYGGADLSTVKRREAFRAKEGGQLEVGQREGAPVLEAVVHDDRYAVIFSPYDLSCAWELQASPQCRGYLTEDAKRIGINVILYSLHE